MLARTRPLVALRRADQQGAHGAEFHVPHRGPRVVPVQRRRAAARIPQAAGQAVAIAEPLGIPTVRVAQRRSQRVGRLGSDQQMDMIRQEAPGPDRQTVCAGIPLKEREVGLAVLVLREDLPPAGTPGGSRDTVSRARQPARFLPWQTIHRQPAAPGQVPAQLHCRVRPSGGRTPSAGNDTEPPFTRHPSLARQA